MPFCSIQIILPSQISPFVLLVQFSSFFRNFCKYNFAKFSFLCKYNNIKTFPQFPLVKVIYQIEKLFLGHFQIVNFFQYFPLVHGFFSVLPPIKLSLFLAIRGIILLLSQQRERATTIAMAILRIVEKTIEKR